MHSEQAGDNIVRMDTIDQPFSVVVDKPADDLGADAGILPVIFLGTPGRKEREAIKHRVSNLPADIMNHRLKEILFSGFAVLGLNPGPCMS